MINYQSQVGAAATATSVKSAAGRNGDERAQGLGLGHGHALNHSQALSQALSLGHHHRLPQLSQRCHSPPPSHQNSQHQHHFGPSQTQIKSELQLIAQTSPQSSPAASSSSSPSPTSGRQAHQTGGGGVTTTNASARRASSPGYHSAASSPGSISSPVSSSGVSSTSTSSSSSSAANGEHQQQRHSPTSSASALLSACAAQVVKLEVGGSHPHHQQAASNLSSSGAQHLQSGAGLQQHQQTRASQQQQQQAAGAQPPPNSTTAMPNLLDYFPDARQDGLRLSWFHAANSRQALSQALASNKLIVTGDIALAELSRYPVPIMARPPVGASDLTLENWLTDVIQARRGIKLTFTSTRTVEPAFRVLARHAEHLKGPIILSADILARPAAGSSPAASVQQQQQGRATSKQAGQLGQQPGQEQQPVDAWTFLMLCRTRFPKSIISIGWCPAGGAAGGPHPPVCEPVVQLAESGAGAGPLTAESMFELDMLMLDHHHQNKSTGGLPTQALAPLANGGQQQQQRAALNSLSVVQQLAAVAAAAAANNHHLHHQQRQQPGAGQHQLQHNSLHGHHKHHGYNLSSTGSLNSSSGNSSGSPSPTSPIGHPLLGAATTAAVQRQHEQQQLQRHLHAASAQHLNHNNHLDQSATANAEQLIFAAAAAAASANSKSQQDPLLKQAASQMVGWPAVAAAAMAAAATSSFKRRRARTSGGSGDMEDEDDDDDEDADEEEEDDDDDEGAAEAEAEGNKSALTRQDDQLSELAARRTLGLVNQDEGPEGQLPLNLNINEADPQHNSAAVSNSAATLNELAQQIQSLRQQSSSLSSLSSSLSRAAGGRLFAGAGGPMASAQSGGALQPQQHQVQLLNNNNGNNQIHSKWEHVSKKAALANRLNSNSPSPVSTSPRAHRPTGSLLCVTKQQPSKVEARGQQQHQHQHHLHHQPQGPAQRASPSAPQMGYTREMIDRMASLVKEYNLTQPVTFPVEARLLCAGRASGTAGAGSGPPAHDGNSSLAELQRLLYQVGANSTLTIVAQQEDLISVEELLSIRKHFSSNQILFDLPDELAASVRNELELL